jgi:hypothetical protein
VPLFKEGIREDVILRWQAEGMPRDRSLSSLFTIDAREEIQPALDPRPRIKEWPIGPAHLNLYATRLDPGDPDRLPGDWQERFKEWSSQDQTIMLRVHRGLYQTLGVGNWRGFEEVNFLLKDNPRLVHQLLETQAHFAVQLVQKILSEVNVDAAIFSEPISDNNGPLISPKMFAEFGAASYLPLLDLLRANGVKTIIFRSYANARILLPVVVEWGFNCLWACEENFGDMEYRRIRREFGRDLRLIGGIDVDVLRQDKAAIRRELLARVPHLLDDGGFIPLADGRIRENVSYPNYCYYRELLEQLVLEAA